ncbi:MAG TPA: hypothetical protein VIX37_01065, partial [Candidatus Sulfotelmatobacter sp.]
RPIGITTFEDKVVQRAVVMLLSAIYERDFYRFSYGFRPGLGAHRALRALREGSMALGGGWIVDADIRGFFGAPGKAWRFQRVQFPPRQGEEPLHRESSLGLMEATT